MSHTADIASIDFLNRFTDTTTVGKSTTKAVMKAGELEYRYVTTAVHHLHEAAKLDRDTYAIARCIASEVGHKRPAMYLLTVAECIKNEARAWDTPQKNPNHPQGEARKSPYFLLCGKTQGEYAFTRGWYGEQHGRWASTAADPSARTVQAARIVLSSETDFASGGRRWFDPRVQDGGSQGGRKLGYDAIGIARKWALEGWQWIGPLPGVMSYEHIVLRNVGKPIDPHDLIKIIELGRVDEKATLGTTSPDRATATVARTGIPWFLISAGIIGGMAITK